MANTKLTLDSLKSLTGLNRAVLTFSYSAAVEKAGKIHDMDCSVAKKALNSKKCAHMMDNVEDDTRDLLERGYGVTLCKCAAHMMVK